MNLHYKSTKSNVVIILIFVVLLLVVLILFKSITTPKQEEVLTFLDEVTDMEDTQENEITEVGVQLVFVDVKGAVKKTGVYEMTPGLRVKDVIEKAGGFSNNADVNQVNLAALLEDEMVIYVPLIGEEVVMHLEETGIKNKSSEKVNINSATSEDLQTLAGIGPSKAATIISYREEHGKFNTVEDLLEVSGIGEKTLEKIKDNLTVK